MPQRSGPIILSFPGGMNNVAPETRVPEGQARAILNADVIGEAGRIRRANGYAAVAGATGGHSLWSHPALNYALYVSTAGNLVKISSDGTRSNVDTVNSQWRMSYTYFARRAYYSNGLNRGYIDETGAAAAWGVDPPPAPLAVTGAGGLPIGRYQLAYTVLFNDGEESAPSLVRQVTLTSDGTITVGPTPNGSGYDSVNLYMSQHDGEELFFVGNFAKNLTAITIPSRQDLGYRLNTLHAIRFPPMVRLCAFKHRILGARDNELWFTDYQQVSLCHRIRTVEGGVEGNPMLWEEPITMMGAVEDGVYVGTERRLWWCQGADPTEWRRTEIDQYGAMRQQSAFYPPQQLLPPQFPAPGQCCAWMSNDGVFCIGRPGGFVQRITENRLAIARHQRAALHYRESAGLRHFIMQLHEQAGANDRAAIDTAVTTTNAYGIVQ